jgi:hypothetical protein
MAASELFLEKMIFTMKSMKGIKVIVYKIKIFKSITPLCPSPEGMKKSRSRVLRIRHREHKGSKYNI